MTAKMMIRAPNILAGVKASERNNAPQITAANRLKQTEDRRRGGNQRLQCLSEAALPLKNEGHHRDDNHRQVGNQRSLETKRIRKRTDDKEIAGRKQRQPERTEKRIQPG